ncbi:MAG TPA: hypothetical protein VE860_16810, partial [Chthoniobacterales bacterium]|nr:hypothetical protein [Chthoniobacterales bacterium]
HIHKGKGRFLDAAKRVPTIRILDAAKRVPTVMLVKTTRWLLCSLLNKYTLTYRYREIENP